MSNPNCYVRATELIGFEELVEGGGISATALLKEAGIDPAKLSEPDSLISGRAFAVLHEIAAEKLNRPNFGLEWMLKTPDHFPNLGPLILLAKLSSNLQDFADLALRYWKYHTNDYTLVQLHDEGAGHGIFRYVHASHALPTRHLAEHAVANIVAVCRKVTNREHDNPVIVRFQHSRPRDTTLHQRIFKCPIEFDAQFTEIVFDPKFLSHHTSGSLTVLKPIVGYYIRHRIQRLPIYDQTMTRTVEMAIPSVSGTGNCNIEFIASSIGLTSKKLRRLLAAEATTFSAILEKVRADMARDYLVQSDAPIASIAGLLDYSSTPPFTLAFRRWTGKSPLQFRKAARVSD